MRNGEPTLALRTLLVLGVIAWVFAVNEVIGRTYPEGSSGVVGSRSPEDIPLTSRFDSNSLSMIIDREYIPSLLSSRGRR